VVEADLTRSTRPLSDIPSNTAELLALLRQNDSCIRSFGVGRLAFFGSFARDECTGDSDVDFLVEFEPGAKSFDSFMGLAFFLEDLIGRRVELVTPESLSPYMRPSILQEAEDAILAP